MSNNKLIFATAQDTVVERVSIISPVTDGVKAMMQKIKKLALGVVVCGCLFINGAAAWAAEPEVVITDDLAPHQPVAQFEAFSTTLSAIVKNKPESNAEAKIVGPTFQWSLTQVGNELKLTSYSGQSVGLYVDPIPAELPMYNSEGLYSLTVKASARFTKTLLVAPYTVSFIDVPSSAKVVSFLSASPK